VGKILESMTTKIVVDLEPPGLVKTEVVEEAKLKVVENSEPKPEMKEPFIEILVVLPVEPTMELFSFSPAMRFPLFLRCTTLFRSFHMRQFHRRLVP